jgi:lysophospholipase L1-like esterase
MRIVVSNIILIVTLNFSALSQSVCDTLNFIHCDHNKIITTNAESTQSFIKKFKNLNSLDAEHINIVHIGDSHLQAGFLTEQIKQELFNYYCSDSVVSPGFIFPYTIAQTNNPFFYQVDYSGEWTWSKNVDSEKTSQLGLSGITVKTTDSLATFSIKINHKNDSSFSKRYGFNTIKLLHNNNHPTSLKINGQKIAWGDHKTFFNLNEIIDSVHFEVANSDSTQYFELYGIILENSLAKINYHSIGVNGATTQSYLKCDYFSKHIQEINPDAIIISLGTNEAFDEEFRSLEHEYILKDLILLLKDSAPNSTIILTSPNDHIKNGMPNKKVAVVRKNIIKVAKEFNLAFWDFYTIMGGKESIEDWYKMNLTGEDKLHFKKKGYEIQAELFVMALIQYIENY